MPRQKKADLTDEAVLEQFIGLCELHCTFPEVAGFFRVSEETMRTRIKDAFGPEATWRQCFDRFSAGGKISLRRSQFKLAKTNASMCIFLGKNYLGQTDMRTVEDVTKPIEISWSDAGRKAAEEGAKKLNELEASIGKSSTEDNPSESLKKQA